MARIKADKRKLDYEPRPEIHARLLARRADWIRMELDCAKDFAAILESKHYYDEDCAGLVEYARKFHYDGRRAMNLARLGQALSIEPRLEEEILSGRIPLESGVTIHNALAHPILSAKADWMEQARTLSPGGLQALYKRMVEEEARGTEDLRVLRLLVTELDRDNFRRLKHLLQIKLDRMLTDGEVHSWAVDFALDKNDPVRKARRMLEKRRAKLQANREDPDGRRARLDALQHELQKQNRKIPAPVLHEVLDRSDGRCEIPGCAFEGPIELMHLVVGYAEGGVHDPRNVGCGCPRHHRLVDGVRIQCIGFSDDERPVFEDSKGRLLYPDPRPPPRKPKSEG